MSTENNSRIVQIPFEEHMATSYLSYAKDVIEARALPSVSDGLKPVQRRILQSMNDLGLHPTTAYKKCARTVGDALGKYHPHGDASVYDAMVNLTQEFKERYPLIDGHGNFGSIDDDPAAAMRYTEARLAPIGELLLTDINKNTVDMVPNYDESEKEAVELPGLFPTLLANGSCGIAVGMSSSFVPHRAKDIYDMLDRVIDNTLNGVETPVDELIDILKAPDFPTGGVITNLNDVYRGYREGKGTVHIRSKYVIETDKKGQVSIVITEIPYRVVKTKMVQQIDDLRKTELSAEIKEVRDESNKDGIRVVIELKKGANEQFTINKLLKKTSMQSTISMNHQALIDGKVQEKLTLMQLVDSFLEHAIRVVRRKSQFELDKKSKRLHIVEGFIAISQDILGACETIIEASSDEEVIEQFAQQFGIDEEQTKSILGMKVSSLKKVSVEEYSKEQENLSNEISHLTAVVSDEFVLLQETKEKLHDIAVKFEKEERLSDISTEDILANITDRDLITKEDIVIMHTHNGLIKAVKINDYNAQRRSGKGISAKTQEDDFVENMITLTTRDDLVFLTNIGKAYVIPAYRIPIVSKQSIGKYVNNYVPTGEGEKVIGVLPIMHNEEAKEYSLFFSSKFGICKRLALDDLPSQKNGAKIVGIRPGDELVACSLVKETDKILLATKKGFAVKTAVSNIRVMGRASSGVIGIRFKTEDDYVISVMCANDEDSILVVSENGIGKQLKASDISTLANKGGKGSTYYKPTSKTGLVKAVLPVATDNTIFIVTQQGMIIRVPAAGISTMGRTAAGVKMVTLSKDDSIASVSAAPEDKDDETEEVV